MTDALVAILAEGRRREKEQTRFYRRLAAEAELQGDERLAERLNQLHADEQHHLSRLTARILELGGTPEEFQGRDADAPEGSAWEEVARSRERAEVEWYREALAAEMDPETRALLREILDSEEHHAEELAGKWMSA